MGGSFAPCNLKKGRANNAKFHIDCGDAAMISLEASKESYPANGIVVEKKNDFGRIGQRNS